MFELVLFCESRIEVYVMMDLKINRVSFLSYQMLLHYTETKAEIYVLN